MQDDHQFTKLFNYMTERFDTLEAKVDTKADASQVDQLQSTVDAVAGDIDTIKTEVAAQNHQLTAHEDWIEQASSHLKVKYDRGA